MKDKLSSIGAILLCYLISPLAPITLAMSWPRKGQITHGSGGFATGFVFYGSLMLIPFAIINYIIASVILWKYL